MHALQEDGTVKVVQIQAPLCFANAQRVKDFVMSLKVNLQAYVVSAMSFYPRVHLQSCHSTVS